MSKINFSELNETASDNDIVDDKQLKNIKNLIRGSYLDFARGFLEAYNLISTNLYLFNSKELNQYMEDFGFIDNLRELFDELGNDVDWLFCRDKIKDIIRNKRKEIDSFIQNFFIIFKEEE